jgi:uncharacterized protein (TIGR03435 family)
MFGVRINKRCLQNPDPARAVIAASIITGILLAASGHAQSQHGRRSAFEAASIRPAAIQKAGGEGSSRSQIEYSADSLTMRNIDLSEMVQWAYGLQYYQVLVSNNLRGRRYDVRAKAGDPVKLSTLGLMLQDLLATRFKVQLHHEQKRTSVYELVVAKGGAKLPKDKADTLPPSYAKETFPQVVDGGFLFRNVSITDFAEQLSDLRGIDLPVVDRTGIQGVYDITLKSAATAILQPEGPSLLTLIREQLGLKLVPAKDPIEMIVVDHAEEPSAN